MPETANYSNRAKYYGVSTPRTLTWIREAHFHGPACSRCAWLFLPSGPPTGISLQQMKENYMRLCKEEFAAHVCAEHPRAAKTNVSVNQPSRLRDAQGRSARTKLQSGISNS
jgi:hypothetical protein